MTRNSHGFTLVSAIFLLVVLVVLGSSIVTLSAVQHTTSAVRIQSLRAHYAARAGLEWAVKRVGASASCGGSFPLGSVDVTVTCASVVHDLGGNRSFSVATATATSGVYGSVDYVSRQLEAKVLSP